MTLDSHSACLHIQIVRKSVQDSPSLPCICNPFLGSQDKIHWSPSPDLTGCSNKVATGCRRNDQWRLPHRPSRRYLRCSFITPASHVQCGGAKATETASLEPVGNCSLFNRCKVGGAATAKTFEPVVRFWLEAKEFTHHSLQGDTALGRNNQKTVHSHWVGPPSRSKTINIDPTFWNRSELSRHWPFAWCKRTTVQPWFRRAS